MFKNRTMKISLLNYLMLGYISSILTSLPPRLCLSKKFLTKPYFLNPHTKLDFSSDNPYFYSIPPRNISDKFNIIRGLSRFLLPGLISSTIFDEKLGFPTVSYKRIYKLIMDLIPNDWKHLHRIQTSQKTSLKTF